MAATIEDPEGPTKSPAAQRYLGSYEAGFNHGIDRAAQILKEQDQRDRFQLARDLLVAQVGMNGMTLDLPHENAVAGHELACRVAVKMADRLIELLAKPQEGGG